jgi:dihydrofolate reductase/thymidylate synthase
MPFSIIVGAHSTNKAIGSAGKIPWKCRADMKFFKEMTTTVKYPTKMNAVIMGRKTFESLPAPLPNRVNVVLSKNHGNLDNGFFSNNFDTAIETLEQDPNIETIFVIGGEMIYKIALDHPKCEKIYLNEVHVVCDLSGSDAFFPEIDTTKYELIETTIIDPTVTSFIFKKKPTVIQQRLRL